MTLLPIVLNGYVYIPVGPATANGTATPYTVGSGATPTGDTGNTGGYNPYNDGTQTGSTDGGYNPYNTSNQQGSDTGQIVVGSNI